MAPVAIENRDMHRCRIVVAAALVCGCVSSIESDARTGASSDGAAVGCTVDGQPLASIPPVDHCMSGPPSEVLAGASWLYSQSRFDEAIALLEPTMASPPSEPAALSWWRQGRMTLARAYAQAGREVEAEATLLAIVRTPDDPWRWAATGFVCGEPRGWNYERCAREEPVQSAGAPLPGSPIETAQRCLARGDHPCAIRALEGRGRTPSEMQLLFETYDAMGNQPRRLAAMERFIRMFPDDPRTPLYEQILAQHTWYRRR